MSSLFDIASTLSQYDAPKQQDSGAVGRSGTKQHVASSDCGLSNQEPEHWCSLATAATTRPNAGTSALALLDDTLLAIYETSTSRPRRVQLQLSASQLTNAPSPSLPSERTVDRLDRRIQELASRLPAATAAAKHSPGGVVARVAPPPLQRAFGHSASSSALMVPPPPCMPPPKLHRPEQQHEPNATQAVSTVDADVDARNALRDITDELEQLLPESRESDASAGRLRRLLSEKYLTDRLDKLPSTPFVVLARKKAQQKIAQLACIPAPTQPWSTTPHAANHDADTPDSGARKGDASAAALLPAAHHDMLQKLMRIPESHVAKLSRSQQDMVLFAKRYQKILNLSPEELLRLPVTQKQLIHQLKKQFSPSATALTHRTLR